MKRMVLNLASLCVIAAGGAYLATPATAQEALTSGTCTAGNGAQCTGDNCCANAEFCYSNCPIRVE